MRFTEARLKGTFVIEPEVSEDERGYFLCTFDRQEMEARGLEAVIAEEAVSYSRRKGTLRGMHYQVAPHAQAKLVRCTRGAVYDVLVDLREDSSTFCQWAAVELSAGTSHTLYVPKGLAHGFLTLEDATEVCYQLSEIHAPEFERGLRWDDPAIGIEWPFAPSVISARDRTFAPFEALRG